jgi:hypothetical protein
MKASYFAIVFILIAHCSVSFASICPDPPINDDPCILSDNPPLDLTTVGIHEGTTCCARGPLDQNQDGGPADLENIVCPDSTENASVWYMYSPGVDDIGYTIQLEQSSDDPAEGPITMEVYWGDEDQGCEGFAEAVASSCSDLSATLTVSKCAQAGDKLFVKVSTNNVDEQCGKFVISIVPTINGGMADNCLDLIGGDTIVLMVENPFGIDYFCTQGSLGFACPETDSIGGCDVFTAMPTVWFFVESQDDAAQMFSTVQANGNWDPVWSVFSGPDCDNLSVVDIGGSPPCSNGDNTIELHQTSVFDDEDNYWLMVSVDPNSIPASGMGDPTFELCVAGTINAIICLGELEGGACSDESLIMEITEREYDDQSLEGPFCQGEEVTVQISFYYDATESGADWLSGFVPIFGDGWDLEGFDYSANAPTGLNRTALWYEEGSDVAPIIQEPVPILCTYRDDDGVLQLCNQLCFPCTECEEKGMEIGDPLPSGYFWVTTGGNAGCDNDGSPGEGWGIGSTTVQIDWTFNLKVKTFDSIEECLDNDDLSIGFQTFTDGVAGCWEDPVGECLLDRTMVSPQWKIGCSELPPNVMVENQKICSHHSTDVTVSVDSEKDITIVVTAIDNPLITGATDYVFEDGVGVISDQLDNLTEEEVIQQYEVYTIDSTLECYGQKTILEVVVYGGEIKDFPHLVCACEGGCAKIGVDFEEGSTYEWTTLETTSFITVCPDTITYYSLVVTDALGCSNVNTTKVDCSGASIECKDPEAYKLIYDFYIDLDQDGIRDASDLPFESGSFVIEPYGEIVNNITMGEDTLLLAEGDYTLIYQSSGLENWELGIDLIYFIHLDENNASEKVEFGLIQSGTSRKIDLSYHVDSRCHSPNLFTMVAKNVGTQIENGILWAEFDEHVTTNAGTSPAVDSISSTGQIGWYFTDLLPGEKFVRSITMGIPGLPSFAVGDELNHKIFTEVKESDGSYTILAEEEISETVYCGYQSNDKLVLPFHELGYTDINQEQLLYKIRFQNKGNEVVENLQVRDELSPFLDPNTVQYLGGSHDEFLNFTIIKNNVLVFDFEGIDLPKSSDDLSESQGYLMFKVSLVDNLPVGTLIENRAIVKFSSSSILNTNTTMNLLVVDADGDGYFSFEDCDDENAEINPGAVEIPNNEVDEDCDGSLFIVDADMDGFNSDEDCNDEDASINPGAMEIPNNEIDEDCDGVALVIDVDMDGFNSDEDCDDENPDINPDAVDIPNNGIDEDCDGMDATILGVNEFGQSNVLIHPNPSNDAFIITFNEKIDAFYKITDIMGRTIRSGEISGNRSTINLGEEVDGVYLLVVKYKVLEISSYHRLMKI